MDLGAQVNLGRVSHLGEVHVVVTVDPGPMVLDVVEVRPLLQLPSVRIFLHLPVFRACLLISSWASSKQ